MELHTTVYLKNKLLEGYTSEEALLCLNAEFAIKNSVWEDELVVLNYDQINSPKFDKITKECRSLVLSLKDFSVVSRSFDRFFNYGEDLTHHTLEDYHCYEKIDGSLIGIFWYKGQWLYRTKSVIMPDAIINGNPDGVTWGDEIDQAIGPFLNAPHNDKDTDLTYIAELVSRYNRVVVNYGVTKPELYLLASRSNTTGKYTWRNNVESDAINLGFESPVSYEFKTLHDCMVAAKELPNLEEGYVLYNTFDAPVIKVKNPAYVAAHHLRGEGTLSERRIMDLILMNETDEYLSIFPEDFDSFIPYMDAYDVLEQELNMFRCGYDSGVYDKLSQKEFALKVKDNPWSPVAFAMRKGQEFQSIWENLWQKTKYDMILSYKAL